MIPGGVCSSWKRTAWIVLCNDKKWMMAAVMGVHKNKVSITMITNQWDNKW